VNEGYWENTAVFGVVMCLFILFVLFVLILIFAGGCFQNYGQPLTLEISSPTVETDEFSGEFPVFPNNPPFLVSLFLETRHYLSCPSIVSAYKINRNKVFIAGAHSPKI
jgi:hypothetical protein